MEFFLDLWLVQMIEFIRRVLRLVFDLDLFFSVFFTLLLLSDKFLLESNRLADHEVSYLLVKVEIEHFFGFLDLNWILWKILLILRTDWIFCMNFMLRLVSMNAFSHNVVDLDLLFTAFIEFSLDTLKLFFLNVKLIPQLVYWRVGLASHLGDTF